MFGASILAGRLGEARIYSPTCSFWGVYLTSIVVVKIASVRVNFSPLDDGHSEMVVYALPVSDITKREYSTFQLIMPYFGHVSRINQSMENTVSKGSLLSSSSFPRNVKISPRIMEIIK